MGGRVAKHMKCADFTYAPADRWSHTYAIVSLSDTYILCFTNISYINSCLSSYSLLLIIVEDTPIFSMLVCDLFALR